MTSPWLRTVACAAGARASAGRLVVACALAVSVPACAAVSSPSVEQFGGGEYAGDGAASATGAGAAAVGFGGDAGAIDASACHPGDVPPFAPSTYHYAEQDRGACSSTALQALYDSCFASPASQCDGPAVAQYASCVSCLETASDAGRYGPLIIDIAGWIRPNVAGCIELSDPTNPAALSCAEGVEVLVGCELAACAANCPVTPDGVSSVAAYDACAREADVKGCQPYVAAAACTQVDAGHLEADGGGSIAACLQTTLAAFYFGAVPLFCGPSASQEGASSPDAGAATFDATTAGGAASDAVWAAADASDSQADAPPGRVDAARGAPDMTPSPAASDAALGTTDAAPDAGSD